MLYDKLHIWLQLIPLKALWWFPHQEITQLLQTESKMKKVLFHHVTSAYSFYDLEFQLMQPPEDLHVQTE